MYFDIYHDAAALLSDHLSAEEIRHWLTPAGFTDWQATHQRLLRLAKSPDAKRALAHLLPYLLGMLSETANPDHVLVNLERFLQHTPATEDRLRYLAHHLRATEILVKLFSGSQFLTEILLRNPEYFDLLMEPHRLSQPKSVKQFCAMLPDLEGARCSTDYLDTLRRFQRAELLRIGTCDILALFDLPVVTAQLSNLADSLIQGCLAGAANELDLDLEGFVVLAMGKLGGSELNYSSDVDLLFLAQESTISYRQLAERLIEALTKVTDEGFLYRVDMRLRPWGSTGALVITLDGYLAYLNRYARPWEKQALLKARAVAGDLALGQRFLERAAPLIFSMPAEDVRESVRTMKQMTEDQLQRQGRAWGEVKLGQGSIRDIEFVTQYLQLSSGAALQAVRSPNTLDALGRLLVRELITPQDCRILVDGYIFLRTIEHYLQMMHYRQTHALPADATALRQLARRLGFEDEEAFLERYEQHRSAIRAVYLTYLGEEPMESNEGETHISEASVEHVARMDVSYTATFTASEIQRHALAAAKLSEDHRSEVEAVSLGNRRWRVTVVGFDYPGVLSLICGLLFVHGLSIDNGQVFTYEPGDDVAGSRRSARRKIVDTFTVHEVGQEVDAATWDAYRAELAELLELMHQGKRQEAHGKLAKRVASSLSTTTETEATLYPVDIIIDNDASDHYTLLRITAPNTLGFLYELTNALAYSHIYIARVSVRSVGNRARDVLYVTDAHGRKITSTEKQRELRAAVVLIKHFTHLLPNTPDPETALLHFREFISHLFRQPEWPDELASLENPEVLNALARLLGVSEFLWDDFLRMQYANLFPVVRDMDGLDTQKTRDQLQAELEGELARVHARPEAPTPNASWQETLNAFKDREMFRIDMRHILGHTQEFWDFSEELTALAEVVVNAAYHLCHEDLRSVHGTPYLDAMTADNDTSDDAGARAISEMTVCALGKCGGRELGFASDIELMFIYSGNGQTSGPNVISTAEFYERLVQNFIQAIQAKREGIFEIDLQLRPYGKSGSMAVSLEAFKRYFSPNGPAWAYERQALVKLRPIAGNAGLGDEVVRLRDLYIYNGQPFDVTAMRAMRERQIRHLVIGGTFNAKYSPGGLVDVEYLVQGLQIAYGDTRPALRRTNIREAMAALANAGILATDDYTQLRKAHTFLRWLIDGLRMVRGNARDLTVPPMDSEAFAFLGRRMRYGNDVQRLREDLIHYTQTVQRLNRKLLG